MKLLTTTSTQSLREHTSYSSVLQDAQSLPQTPAQVHVPTDLISLSPSKRASRKACNSPNQEGNQETMRYAPLSAMTPPLSPTGQSVSSTPPGTPSDSRWASPESTDKLWDPFSISPISFEEESRVGRALDDVCTSNDVY